jgi:hypothetical protein
VEAREITINGLFVRCGRAGGRRAGPSLVQQSYNAATKELDAAFTQVNELTSGVGGTVGKENADDVPF